ncbi:hypothetical protein [uncultured Lactobacillus sp.]|uniref:hypothetical protein n=1 Tax=uncultured Lactobacillus sp. TaxID=153152 RepID=UPI0026209EB3|nr:hypothetical protein [uncultured Lactobacillus sp.]
MKNIESMDILRVPNKEDILMAKIDRWIDSSFQTYDQTVTIIFKKDTPRKILILFNENRDLFPKLLGYKVNEQYQIAKK